AGVCGDGGELVGFGRVLYIWPSMESHGRWNAPRCAPGNARVAITVAGGRPVSLRTYVGGSWSGAGATDLGTVSGPAAAAFFISLAVRADGRLSRDALLPAVIAEGADVADDLLRIGRDRDRPTETRSRALQWAGQLGGERVVAPLLSIARDANERRNVREAALLSLSSVPDGSGVPPLLELVRGDGDSWLQAKAVFWLAETEDARATELLHRLVLQENADVALRKAAIFALGHQSETWDASFLDLYGKLESPSLKEHFIFVLSQRHEDGAVEKLIDIARSDPDREMRKKALFWLGQSDDPRAARLIRDLVTN
ncbi:MAG: HEAT repeat domain-containing protein, partial [Gemmatimonadaceae bacterium]